MLILPPANSIQTIFPVSFIFFSFVFLFFFFTRFYCKKKNRELIFFRIQFFAHCIIAVSSPSPSSISFVFRFALCSALCSQFCSFKARENNYAWWARPRDRMNDSSHKGSTHFQCTNKHLKKTAEYFLHLQSLSDFSSWFVPHSCSVSFDVCMCAAQCLSVLYTSRFVCFYVFGRSAYAIAAPSRELRNKQTIHRHIRSRLHMCITYSVRCTFVYMLTEDTWFWVYSMYCCISCFFSVCCFIFDSNRWFLNYLTLKKKNALSRLIPEKLNIFFIYGSLAIAKQTHI